MLAYITFCAFCFRSITYVTCPAFQSENDQMFVYEGFHALLFSKHCVRNISCISVQSDQMLIHVAFRAPWPPKYRIRNASCILVRKQPNAYTHCVSCVLAIEMFKRQRAFGRSMPSKRCARNDLGGPCSPIVTQNNSK